MGCSVSSPQGIVELRAKARGMRAADDGTYAGGKHGDGEVERATVPDSSSAMSGANDFRMRTSEVAQEGRARGGGWQKTQYGGVGGRVSGSNSTHSAHAAPSEVLEDTYITEDMLTALSERSSRLNGGREGILQAWLQQIPSGYPGTDPLERHQASMNALNQLQWDKSKGKKSNQKRSKK